MKINISEVLSTRDYAETYAGNLQEPGIDNFGQELKFKAPPEISVRVTNKAGVVTLSAAVQGVIIIPCARCQKDTEFGFSLELEEDITDTPSVVFDVGELARDAIAAEIPIRVLCSDDCKGLCQYCGCDKNLKSCDCEPPALRRIDIKFE